MSRQFDFDGANLAKAIQLTFKQRGTTLPVEIEAFKESFIEAKQGQWEAFWRRLQQEHVPVSFSDVTASVERFLSPVITAISSGKPWSAKWATPGPWY